MLVETAHVWNTPGKGFFLRGMCGHKIRGILTLDFQRLSAFFSFDNKQSGVRSSSADTVVSPSPESALVDETVSLQLFWNCFNLSRPATIIVQCTKKMAAWEMYADAINSWSASSIYENLRNPHVLFLVRAGTYQYVPNSYSCTDLYRYVLVRTRTYRYVRFCLILSSLRCKGFQMNFNIVPTYLNIVC
jgi:hypothetical protein